jgi:hypothetical protein
MKVVRPSLRAAVLVLVALAASCGETEEVVVERGYRGEALRNPYLAAERVVRELGREVEARQVLDVPDANVATVFVDAARLAYPSGSEAAILDWARAGGHLVVTVFGGARPSFPDWRDTTEHPLLTELGVEVSGEPATSDESFAGQREDWDVRHYEVYGAGRFRGLAVEVADEGRLINGLAVDLEPDGRLVRNGRIAALTFPYGAGRATVLLNGSFASNLSIARADNALFLWQLVDDARPGSISFVEERDQTLLGLLWERAHLFVVAGLLLIVLWLWWLTLRFGPPVADPEPARHAFEDHVVAAGRFMRRYAGTAAIVEPLRRRALRAAERGLFHAPERTVLVESLAQRSGLDPERVEHVLFGQLTDDSNSLVAIARDLHQLERAHD